MSFERPVGRNTAPSHPSDRIAHRLKFNWFRSLVRVLSPMIGLTRTSESKVDAKRSRRARRPGGPGVRPWARLALGNPQLSSNSAADPWRSHLTAR